MYRSHADLYDQATGVFNGLRQRAVELLQLRPGSTVIDAGCGTGLCFPYLQKAIGPTGHVIAVDQSEPMLDQAMGAAERQGWHNVTPVRGAAEEAPIPGPADAALFCAAHDIMRCPGAVKNVLSQVVPGGRVVATGGKWPPPWLWHLRPMVVAAHAPYVTSFEGFDRPWSLLAEHCPNLVVEPVAFGTGYLATGTLPADREAADAR
jgi:demethylmenaquinone methyltransferase/2-methoxy-6-polyprenyl-1,4-benzoquinol methylase